MKLVLLGLDCVTLPISCGWLWRKYPHLNMRRGPVGVCIPHQGAGTAACWGMDACCLHVSVFCYAHVPGSQKHICRLQKQLSKWPAFKVKGDQLRGAPAVEGEAPEEAASRWREGVLEDAGASSSFADVFNLSKRSRYISAPPVAPVRQTWSPAAAQVLHQSLCCLWVSSLSGVDLTLSSQVCSKAI